MPDYRNRQRSVHMTNKKLSWGPKAMFRFWLARTVGYLIMAPFLTMLIAALLMKIEVVPTIGGASFSAFLFSVLPICAFFVVGIIWFSLKTLRCRHCGSHMALRVTDKGVINGYYTTWPARCKFCSKSSLVKIKTTGSNSTGGGSGGGE